MYLFKSRESVKAHLVRARVDPQRCAARDALSRLNFARFTGRAIERDFSADSRASIYFRSEEPGNTRIRDATRAISSWDSASYMNKPTSISLRQRAPRRVYLTS